MGHRHEHDLDVMMFMQITRAKRLKGSPPLEMKAALLHALADPHVQLTVKRAIQKLRALRAASPYRRVEGVDGWITKNHREIRELMRWFAFEIAVVPSCVRPILWRYVWEERKRDPSRLIPEGHGVRVQALFSKGYDFTSIDGRRQPYSVIVVDPFLAIDRDIDEARDFVRTAFGVPADKRSRRGRSPLVTRTILTAALLLGLYLDYMTPVELRTELDPRNWKRLKRAWDEFRSSPKRPVDDALLLAIKTRVESTLGSVIGKTIIRRTLKAWSPPPPPPLQ